MDVRALKTSDLELAGALLQHSFERSSHSHGVAPPWRTVAQASALLERYLQAEPGSVVVAEEGGAMVGVGALRLRGEVATIGPIASAIDGRGVGGAVLDELLRRADEGGAGAQRLYVDAWNPAAYALYAGRGFGVVDTVAHVERAPAPGPALESARGLEVRPAEPGDHEELVRLDRKLTGHDRGVDLGVLVRLVARRRGEVVGYLGAQVAPQEGGEAGGDGSGDTLLLGPAVAVDASDLFTLLSQVLAPGGEGALADAAEAAVLRARLSTTAPAAAMAAIGLGFRIRELGMVMSRGAPPPARPPQLYSIDPEVV
ncbi:GNAT family N-acetyltransferase [Haliangium sp.]|uniref:GNAT family N-acetyltransferase n=1 Tax=Haliangium sp. TaxID=2663208 RepID=UPI003D103FB7